MGGGKGGGASGGSMGDVDYPDEMKTHMYGWLDAAETLIPTPTTAVTNPYAASDIHGVDPNDFFDTNLTEDTKEDIEELNHVTDFEEIADAAAAKMTTLVDTDVTTAVANFEERQTSALLRSMSRFAAGMVDINAVNGSAFLQGMALMEADHLRNVAVFNGDAELKLAGQRYALMGQAISEMSNALRFRTDARIRMTAVETDVNKIRYASEQMYMDKEIELAVRDSTWHLELYQYANNILASISGAALVPGDHAKKHESGGLMGALQGAMGGAAAGSIGGPWGAAGGAVAGGIMGFMG